MPAQPQADSLSRTACGAESVPRKNFGFPEVALQSYATVFDEEGALDRFEAFASVHGARFYDLPLNAGSIVLERTPWRAPSVFAAAGDQVVPFQAGASMAWTYRGPIDAPS